jgi:hypothetical protein
MLQGRPHVHAFLGQWDAEDGVCPFPQYHESILSEKKMFCFFGNHFPGALFGQQQGVNDIAKTTAHFFVSDRK